jgi:flagellin-like hook-associated protein FlgL
MRVTNLSRKYQIESQIQAGQARMLEAQARVADGKRIHGLSDDPVALSKILDFQSRIRAAEQYQENAEYGSSLLSLAVDTLAEVEGLVLSARDAAINAANGTTEEDEAQAIADQARSITSQVTALMNTRYNDRYLFGGYDSDTPPFAVGHDGGVIWQGDDSALFFATGPGGMRTQINVDGRRAIAGRPAMLDDGAIDLNPDIDTTSRLADLHSGEGVSMGAFEIHDRSGNVVQVDLMAYEIDTISDLIETINTMPGIEVNAAINAEGTGITLTDTSPNPDPELGLKVLEVDDGTTAAELGIWEIAGRTDGIVVGTDLDPQITADTDVELLNGGAGFDHGDIYLVNGDASAYVDLSGLDTVQDILDRINNSGTGVEAQINSRGDGIQVRSLSHGTTLHISDIGNGHTAADLGIAGNATEEDLFALLHDLEEVAQEGDQDGANALIDSLSAAVAAVTSARASAGVQLQELELSAERLSTMTIDLEMARAGIEDADFAKAVTDLTTSQVVYQAALSTTTSVLNLNLTAYL